jgi:hypothetical protein
MTRDVADTVSPAIAATAIAVNRARISRVNVPGIAALARNRSQLSADAVRLGPYLPQRMPLWAAWHFGCYRPARTMAG